MPLLIGAVVEFCVELIGHVFVDLILHGAFGVSRHATKSQNDQGADDRPANGEFSVAGLFLMVAVFGVLSLLGILVYLLAFT